MSRLSSRDAILAAAVRVVRSTGVAALTLDAVALAAGVSKGGLLYHFPSKDALIDGMIAAAFDTFDAEVGRLDRHDGPGSLVRAYVDASFTEITFDAALLAALGAQPELIRRKEAWFSEWQRRIEDDGIDPVLATAIRLAADGLWVAEVYGLAPPTGDRREALRTLLITLTGGTP